MPKWMIRPDKYNTMGGSGQLTATPSAKTTVTLISMIENQTQQRSSLEQALAQLEGRYIDPLILGAGNLIDREYERHTFTNLTTTNALTANWSPVAWLPIYATGGLNTNQRVDKTYIPYGIFVSRGGVEYDSTGSYGVGRGATLDKTLSAGTTIPVPGLSLGVGGNYHSGTTNDFSAYTNYLTPGISDPSTFPQDPNVPSPIPAVLQSSANAATYGWYVEPRLNIASRFFAAPGFRLDGGSSTGANAGLTGLPKLDLSYLMVNRQDAPLWGVVNLFRPRVALGVAGTQPSPTDKLRLYARSTGGNTPGTVINLNGSLVPVTFLSSIGNTTLQPERSRELEGGFETDLWNNRLGLTYTRYNKVRHNAIVPVPVAASVYGGSYGASTYNVNIGEIRNTGTELSVNAQMLQSRAIGWNVGLSFSNVNEVLVKLRPGQTAYNINGSGGSITRLAVGYPLWGRWAYPILSYVDVNHDGFIESNEVRYGDSLVYLGQQIPKTTMGMHTDVTLFHGTLGMHASVAYQGGFTQYDAAALGNGTSAQLGNAPGTTLATQAAIVAALDNKSAIGLVQTVSALRFQDLSINYQVPTSLSQWLRVPRMQVALQGSNLGLHTNYRGLDPNVNAYTTVAFGNGGQQSADTGQLPMPRTWSFYVTLGN
jgi:outer membrane receptor protein involved in Fe transport